MAKKRFPTAFTDEDRKAILRAVQTSTEPQTASALAKNLKLSCRVREADLVPILSEFVIAGRLHEVAPQSPKGKQRYWHCDVRVAIRAALLETLQTSDEPLTCRDLVRRLKTFKPAVPDAEAILAVCVSEGSVHHIPPATRTGAPRYWTHGVAELARRSILRALDAKGPQPEAALRKSAKGISDACFLDALQSLVAERTAWRYPPLGKSRILFGRNPPAPGPYLQEFGGKLASVVGNLLAAGVPLDDVRRALVQLVEGAGVPFGATNSKHEMTACPRVDLIQAIRHLEPGADRGALVGASDLRRAVQMEKIQFDRSVLELAQQGRLSLHRHDYPAGLSAAERDELVADGNGSYYVGVALRRDPM
jgi:hypothetical protein